MYRTAALLALSLLNAVSGQQIGTLTAENHPRLTVQSCTSSGCTTQSRSVVLDSNWRWLHDGRGTNCYTGNEWSSSLCPDPTACANNCYLDGADYASTYGISTSGNALTLKFITRGQYSTNIGSRVYLMEDDNNYQMFRLLNQEFTFDVDMSGLPCGLNGALYFIEMARDGGRSQYSTNNAGARYGTGYCDSQCPHDIKFINGQANINGWQGTDPNSGAGQFGTCCSEMDIWEANSQAAAYTPHTCTVTGQYRCQGTECGDGDNRYGGVCDKDGCDYNSWRMGDQTFLGPGKTINTNQKITVVTQFFTNNNQTTGTLSEIRRIYVQNGRVVQNSVTKLPGLGSFNSLTDQNCADMKQVFGDTNSFASKGGMAGMGRSLANGMVLALSLWDDHTANMLWLNSNYPVDADPSKPGVSRGPCSTSSGRPEDVEAQHPDATVIYSNIRYGPIGSTYR